MTRPTSFRLPEELLKRLDEEASSQGTSATVLLASILDEGLKMRRFPRIVYRDGPTGRRAAVEGGPDVWEIIRDLKPLPGDLETRIRLLVEGVEIPERWIRAAVDFYTAYPEEVDDRIALNEAVAEKLQLEAERRERLFAH